MHLPTLAGATARVGGSGMGARYGGKGGETIVDELEFGLNLELLAGKNETFLRWMALQ